MNYDTSTLFLFLTQRQLPARLNVEQTAELLGFTAPDLTIIMSDSGVGLKPLGSPAQNAPKYFAAVDVLNLAGDSKRLGRATEVVRKHHLHKRSARKPVQVGSSVNHSNGNRSSQATDTQETSRSASLS